MPDRCVSCSNRFVRLASSWLIGLSLGATAGCNLLLPFVFLGEHKQKVPAEFDKLADKRAAVVVWAEQETLFDYPYVRLEIAAHVADELRGQLNVELIDSRKVEDYLQRTLATAVDPEDVGRQFDCDMVVYIELLQFQIRDPDAPDFLRATIHGSIVVYDLTADPDEPRRYDLTDVHTLYPPDAPVMFTATSGERVRKAAYEDFAGKIARKFYEHEQEL